MENILSLEDLSARTMQNEKSFLLLYMSGNTLNNCAIDNLTAAGDNSGQHIYCADVATVKDIHQTFGITSVPALLVFDRQNLTSVIKGCHDPLYYKAIFESTASVGGKKRLVTTQKRVTVYSTPTCTWCNTLKAWLNKNQVRYTDVDVSKNQKAADDLVKRTGQQGVPQTDINGQIVVGFNQQKLKELLEIK